MYKNLINNVIHCQSQLACRISEPSTELLGKKSPTPSYPVMVRILGIFSSRFSKKIHHALIAPLGYHKLPEFGTKSPFLIQPDLGSNDHYTWKFWRIWWQLWWGYWWVIPTSIWAQLQQLVGDWNKPIWKIWVRHIGESFPHKSEWKYNMFETTT